MLQRRALIILAAFAVGAVVLAAAIGLALAPRGGAPTQAAIGGPFRLIDEDGRTITDADFDGRPLLVFFGYTHCPDVCPTTLAEMSEVLEALGPDAAKIGAVFITVDPERDTPAVMKSYLGSFHPGLRGLSGTPEEIAAVVKEYRAYARKVPTADGDYTMDHTAVIYLMDKAGKFVAPFNLDRTPDAAAAELRRYF